MAPDAAPPHDLSSLDGCPRHCEPFCFPLFSVSHHRCDNSSDEMLGREKSKEERWEVDRSKENSEVGCFHPRDKGNAEIL